MTFYDHYVGFIREWPYDVPRQPHPYESQPAIVVKDLKIGDPLEFRTRIPLESSQDWYRLPQLSINKVERTYGKRGLQAPDEVKLEYGMRQIELGIQEQQTLVDHDGYFQRQAKLAEDDAWKPVIGENKRKELLKGSASRLSRKYGIEDLQSPAFTRTLQDPPSENSLGSRIKRVFRKGGESADKGIDFLAGLEDKSGMLTDSGDLVSQAISAVPVLTKSGALDTMDGASQFAQGVKAGKLLPLTVAKSAYKYYNAEDDMLETTQRQHKLARDTARAKHTRNLQRMITSQRNGKSKSKEEEKNK